MTPDDPADGRAAWRAWIADQVSDRESRGYRFGAALRDTAQSARRAWRTAEHRARMQGPLTPGTVVVTHLGRRFAARVRPTAGSLELHLAAAAAVHEALDSAGVRHFAYTDSSTRVRIGISAADRSAAFSSLQRWSRVNDTPMVVATGPRARPDIEPVTHARPAATQSVGLPVVDADASLVLGIAEGVLLDLWDVASNGRLTARATNRWATSLPRAAQEPAELAIHGLALPTFAPLADTHVDDVRFPVDAVITWVDGSDPAWRARYKAAGGADLSDERHAARYHALDELRFALRSVATFAGWIRHVHLVTDGQVPAWLEAGPGLSVVDHRDIWSDPTALPVFNSHAIEARLHHIDGLAEQWLHLNDDLMFGRATRPEQYFAGNGSARFFPAPLHVGFGRAEAGEGTPSLAGRNNREILRKATGTVQTLKLHHAPQPQLTSVAQELEEAFPAEYERTWRSRFRAATDISPITLQTWYGWATGRCLPGTLEERYYDLRTDRLEARLRYLLRHRHLDAFCLNMGEEHGTSLADNMVLTAGFLPRYLPFASPWERS